MNPVAVDELAEVLAGDSVNGLRYIRLVGEGGARQVLKGVFRIEKRPVLLHYPEDPPEYGLHLLPFVTVLPSDRFGRDVGSAPDHLLDDTLHIKAHDKAVSGDGTIVHDYIEPRRQDSYRYAGPGHFLKSPEEQRADTGTQGEQHPRMGLQRMPHSPRLEQFSQHGATLHKAEKVISQNDKQARRHIKRRIEAQHEEQQLDHQYHSREHNPRGKSLIGHGLHDKKQRRGKDGIDHCLRYHIPLRPYQGRRHRHQQATDRQRTHHLMYRTDTGHSLYMTETNIDENTRPDNRQNGFPVKFLCFMISFSVFYQP